MNTRFYGTNSKLSNNANPRRNELLKNNDTKLFISHNYDNVSEMTPWHLTLGELSNVPQRKCIGDKVQNGQRTNSYAVQFPCCVPLKKKERRSVHCTRSECRREKVVKNRRLVSSVNRLVNSLALRRISPRTHCVCRLYVASSRCLYTALIVRVIGALFEKRMTCN